MKTDLCVLPTVMSMWRSMDASTPTRQWSSLENLFNSCRTVSLCLYIVSLKGLTMNYYEQFYDDLEFCDPDDDPYYPRDPYYDRNYRDDPRRYRDYSEQNRLALEQDRYQDDMDFYYGRPHGDYDDRPPLDHFYDRRVPYGSGHNERAQIDRGRGRARGSEGRGRGQGPPRGRGRGTGNKKSDRGSGRGNFRGGLKGMNFVKAGESSGETGSKPADQGENKIGNDKGSGKQTNAVSEALSKSDQIRFDYRKFQSEKTDTEKEVEEALKAYRCQLGFGYGYGPRSDLIEGEQPEWLIGQESEPEQTTAASVTSDEAGQGSAVSTATAPVKTVVKKAMVSPAFNFVKAQSEFHSIDVAFHENEKVEEKPKPNSLSVNFGNKRVGLGFGVSASKGNSTGIDISTKFYSGVKDGRNAQLDNKFAKLQKAVKDKSLPNKNGIEIIHMAVDRVKMVISDEILPGGRTPTGQPMFKCALNIDGVFIAEGIATAKKAAKHEAYHNALKVFENEELTVKETSKGVFELRPKETVSQFKVPAPIGPALGSNPIQSRPTYIPAHKSQTGSSATSQNVAQSKTPSSKSGTSLSATYTKPKIVFHQSSNHQNNQPLEYENAESSQTGLQIPASKAEATAVKLLNFVKEGEKIEKQVECSQAVANVPANINNPIGQHVPSSSYARERKRSFEHLQTVDTGRLKVQKKGGNVQHSIEDLSQFILIDNSLICSSVNELGMLHNSANFNRVVLKLEYENDFDKNDVRCSLVLSDIVVSIAHGSTKEEAKAKVASEALNYLKECCYTIRIKQHVDSDASGLTKEQLLSDIQRAADGGCKGENIIPDSNIGNMLLRKMGWVGGGVGKDGQGIAEPVKTEMVIGRKGLGLDTKQGTGGNFKKRVTKMLEDYIKTDDQRDLHFSSELTKEERAVIHTIGQKMGLKTHSKGKDNNRYLIVSRKRSAKQLLEFVRESGGSTSRYELIPPNDPDLDMMRREDISHGHCKQ